MENQQQLMAQLRNVDVMAKVNQEIPAQVLLSKPVILLDARGRYLPFHLESVGCAEVYASSLISGFFATYIAYTGSHRPSEGSIQGRWPTQDRERRICT